MSTSKIQVIMLQDVKNIGRKNELLNVAPSYAQNVLFKNWYAKLADKATIDKLARDKAKKQAWQQDLLSQTQSMLADLKEQGHSISAKVSPAGKLYAKIDNKTLAQSLSDSYGFHIEPNILTVDKIDHVWEYEVKINYDTIKSTFTLTVLWVK